MYVRTAIKLYCESSLARWALSESVYVYIYIQHIQALFFVSMRDLFRKFSGIFGHGLAVVQGRRCTMYVRMPRDECRFHVHRNIIVFALSSARVPIKKDHDNNVMRCDVDDETDAS